MIQAKSIGFIWGPIHRQWPHDYLENDKLDAFSTICSTKTFYNSNSTQSANTNETLNTSGASNSSGNTYLKLYADDNFS